MKKVIFLALIGCMVISCALPTYKDYFEDTNLYAELLIEDDDWVILMIRNNSTSQIQLLSDNAYYTNVGRFFENTVLIPLQENTGLGTKVLPILIEPGRTIFQRFVAPRYIDFVRGRIDEINEWTPRNKRDIQTASFSFDYEIDGEIQHFLFEQFRLEK